MLQPRAVMCAQPAHPHCSHCTTCQDRNAQCDLWTTAAACLCLTFACRALGGCASLLPRRPTGIFLSNLRKRLECGQPIKTQYREKGTDSNLLKQQNQYLPLYMVNGLNLPLVVYCKLLICLQSLINRRASECICAPSLIRGFSPISYHPQAVICF